MTAGRELTTDVTVILITKYKRTDQLNPNVDGLLDNLTYKELNLHLVNGNGDGRADLQYHEQRIIDSSTEIIDINGDLRNKWEDILAFQAVRFMMIVNRNIGQGYIDVNFKNEQYRIGPEGARVISEPRGGGIEAIVSSTSSEEGALTVSADDLVTYDLIIIGSTFESSSSGL